MTRAAAGVVAGLLLVIGTGGHAYAQSIGPDIECSAPVDGDTSTLEARADEHFRRGSQLYNEGQYELAIPEFLAVYCLIPVPEAAFNIASSYLGLVDYERGLAWLELYVRLLPPDKANERKAAANRIDRIRKLPARISVSTQPAYAKVTLTSDEGTIEGRADDKDPLKVPAGRYVLRVSLDGFDTVEQNIDVRIGQPYTYSFRLSEQQGPLRVTTNPLSARIFVDDKLVAVGTYTADVAVGRHKVTVEASGRKPRTQDVDVKGGDEPVTVFVNLPAPPKSGRWELIGAMTLITGATGGTLGSTVFEQNSTGASLITVGAGALGFAGGYFGVDHDIPVGHTSWIIGGTVWGLAEGAALSALFTDDEDVVGSAAFAGLVSGAVLSAITVNRFDPSEGDSAFINSGGLWGGVGGIMLWGLFRDEDNTSGTDLAPFALAGLNTGLLAGAALAYRYEYSRGHIALIDVVGLAGAITGVAVSSPFSDAASGGTDDTQLHFSFAGMVVGLVAGAVLTRNMDVDASPAGAAAARVAAAMPEVRMMRTMAGETVPGIGWSGVW